MTQQALARALSYSLVPTLPRSTLHRFLRAFWITISRDFHALDRLRLDKYLFLIRCYVGVGFEVFLKGQGKNIDGGKGRKEDKKRKRNVEMQGGKKKKRSKRDDVEEGEEKADEEEEQGGDGDGDDEIESKWPGLSSYIAILEEGPLYPRDFDPDQKPADDGAGGSVPIPHGPDGLRYHLIDLWIDELEKVLEFEEDDEAGDGESMPRRKVKGEVPMDLLLRPIETLRTQGAHKPVRNRAKEALGDDRLVEWGFREKQADEDEEESEDEWGGFGDA